MSDVDTIRVLRFRPYRDPAMPSFVLCIWDTRRVDRRGCSVLGYRLNMLLHSANTHRARERITVFEGEDFAGSPLHADDSDATARSLMTFLTLRPGDTDAEYFASDTELQRAYRDEHAEALGYEVERRFGDGY